MNIILQKNTRFYLEDLVVILVKKKYFSSKLSAKVYVQGIYDFIEFQLPDFPSRNSPKNLLFVGSKYAFYKANSRTTWYIFFEKNENRYLVTFITNNHSEFAGYF